MNDYLCKKYIIEISIKQFINLISRHSYSVLIILSLFCFLQISNAQQGDIPSQDKMLLNSLTKEEKAFLESHPVIKVANQESWPPFDYIEDGIPKGYCIEHMQLLAAKLGLHIEYVSDYRWGNLFELFKKRKIDVMPILYKNPQREPYTLYTAPYFKTSMSLYSIEDNTSLNSIDDLKGGIKVGIHHEDASIPYIKNKFPDIEIVELPGSREIIKALASRKVDAVIENAYIFHYNVKQYQVYNLKLVDFIEPNQSEVNPSLHIGVRKDYPLLQSVLQKAMLTVTEEEKDMLREKWLGDITRIHKDLLLSEEEKEYLDQKESVKMCVDPNWMPFEQIDKNGQFKGISADIVQMISKIINKPIELVSTESWTQTLENLKNRQCDIIPLVGYSEKRSEFMNFTKPYIFETLVITTKNDEFFIQESSELKNRKIGVVEGYIYIQLLKQKHPSIDIVEVKSAKEGLERVQKGELFGFVDVLPTIAYTIQNNGMLDLKVAGRLEFGAQFCVASRDDEPLLNSIMQKALDQIKEEQIKSIVGKWVAIKVEQSFDYRKLIYISLFFISILFVIILKNRSIRKINKELERAYREKDKFFSIIAHDLNGPIGNIANILNSFEWEDIKGQLFNHLRISSQNTYELLLELLTWAQAQKNQLEIDPTNFNINQIIKKSISSLELSANKKEVELVLHNENDDVYVYADIPTINTVIRNLISNAIKFTSPGGTITLKAEMVNDEIKVSVIDTGVGMTKEMTSKLFKLGEDISSSGTMGERGTGLGLLLCKEFIDLNKGKIGVESQLGIGSTFWFTLSAGQENEEESLLDVIKEKQLEALVIEDNFLNLQSTTNELSHLGINNEIASTGIEGIEKGLDKKYDFILLDINLPRKNGIEVNREIRRKYPSSFIIALSSYDRAEIQDMDRSVVFDDYLKKPLKTEHLLNCLKRLK
ncbi:transporter substrate-binding domain-containing protein [Plebeiibacterium sediminum]|uniref:histidine kinase n=1 Tax=Plebeiibacterium sediminum TaxID=2992112 RepID=A0AAE3SH21_9BACT|nr:transporter substrate-binding domain-containing protein [Plebeiobacterium sediminum]MCW3788896.1 transporter substrate-binding domain-containing protein [Plebeiobacterium sediminum]